MKKSRFTDSQILDAIKRVEAGITVPEMCRELGISSAMFYKWRAKYGGMGVPVGASSWNTSSQASRNRTPTLSGSIELCATSGYPNITTLETQHQ